MSTFQGVSRGTLLEGFGSGERVGGRRAEQARKEDLLNPISYERYPAQPTLTNLKNPRSRDTNGKICISF